MTAYPLNFDTICNLFHCYHYRILIRLPDGNRPTDFEMTFWFDIWPMCSQDTIVVECVLKRKNQSSITNEVFLDVQLRVSQISLMRKFLLCTYCRFALVNLFSPTVNLVPPPPYNWKWCSTTSIPVNHSYLSVFYLILGFFPRILNKVWQSFFLQNNKFVKLEITVLLWETQEINVIIFLKIK
jgi:hypothetical protein